MRPNTEKEIRINMRIMNTNLFIEKSKIIHNNFYIYDKSEYVSNKTMITITCPDHGDFKQTPNNHLTGYGCIKCSINSRKNKRKMNNFIEVSKSKFLDKFDYSEVEYINNSTNIKLGCDIHGFINVTPSVHLKSKTGCPKCSTLNASNLQKLNINDLLCRFNKIHKNKYNYNNIFYINFNSKVEILCEKHGSFWQSPKKHLNGSGCPVCISSKGENVIIDFLNKHKLNYNTQYKFKDCTYIRPLKFDFYLPNKNIIIEFDGEQHFYPLSIFGGEKAYELQKVKDNIKDNYCKEKNIKMFRIKYNDNISEKLIGILNEI